MEQRAQLLDRMGEMQRSLDRLNYKIENYEKVLQGKVMPKQLRKAAGRFHVRPLWRTRREME